MKADTLLRAGKATGQTQESRRKEGGGRQCFAFIIKIHYVTFKTLYVRCSTNAYILPHIVQNSAVSTLKIKAFLI